MPSRNRAAIVASTAAQHSDPARLGPAAGHARRSRCQRRDGQGPGEGLRQHRDRRPMGAAWYSADRRFGQSGAGRRDPGGRGPAHCVLLRRDRRSGSAGGSEAATILLAHPDADTGSTDRRCLLFLGTGTGLARRRVGRRRLGNGLGRVVRSQRCHAADGTDARQGVSATGYPTRGLGEGLRQARFRCTALGSDAVPQHKRQHPRGRLCSTAFAISIAGRPMRRPCSSAATSRWPISVNSISIRMPASARKHATCLDGGSSHWCGDR